MMMMEKPAPQELVKMLHGCIGEREGWVCAECEYDTTLHCNFALMHDAADAIGALQAEVGQWKAAVKGQEDGIKVLQTEVKRLKDVNDELREAQTYIDHYGDKWMTSAKDVPTSAYNHGYMDGKNEAEQAQLPKRGEWFDKADEIDKQFGRHLYVCSLCGKQPDFFIGGTEDWWPSKRPNYCPNCGAKMEVQDDKA